MGFKCGIVGLPNVGKSTLFNCLVTTAKAPAENYPFCTISPNTGVVEVPDERLWKISELVGPEKTTPTVIEFVDIAGLVKGASKGEGLGNQFLANIRNVNAIAHVVRCFDNADVAHVYGSVDPVRDVEIIELELALKDLETVERRIGKIVRRIKSGDKAATTEMELLEKLKETLANGVPVRHTMGSLDEESKKLTKELQLLTAKPIMFVANVDESSISNGNEYTRELEKIASDKGVPVIRVCASFESELAELPPQERREFLRDLGTELSGLEKMITQGYRLLDLITFFTAGKKEVRAWTAKKGVKAPEAAGKIHSDMMRGFIRAEVIKYEDFIREGSFQACRNKGTIKLEGKDYILEDGDIIHFRFNV